MSEVAKLPKIQDLVSDANEAFKNDQFKLLVNQQPPASWIKVNKFANNSQYVPIDKIEYLLDKIIQHWKIEILETKQMFNSVMVTVRVHYKHPIDGNWYFHDGVACKELQTKKDSGSRVADIGAGGKEYNVKTDAAWDAAKKKVSKGLKK